MMDDAFSPAAAMMETLQLQMEMDMQNMLNSSWIPQFRSLWDSSLPSMINTPFPMLSAPLLSSSFASDAYDNYGSPLEISPAPLLLGAPLLPAPVGASLLLGAPAPLEAPRSVTNQTNTPTVNIQHTATATEYHVVVPDHRMEELQVDLHGNQLTITGHKEQQKDLQSNTHAANEDTTADFMHCFLVPEGMQAHSIGANLHNGVLCVTVPHVNIPLPAEPKAVKQ